LVAAASIPIVAEHVPRELTGERDLEAALAMMTQPGQMVCVTLGARGAALIDARSRPPATGQRAEAQGRPGRSASAGPAEADVHHAPPFAVETVDTTGAGDVFRGAFIYALLRGDEPAHILRFANAAAAISCTREGAMGGIPTLAEIERLLTAKGTKSAKDTNP
jgi:sugar/nucleoside kinase (ribokinase family)